MTFSEFPLIPLPKPQIDWETEIYNLPQSFPTTWDDIADKPSTFPPPNTINVNKVTCEELVVISNEGGNSHIGYGGHGDIYLTTKTGRDIYRRQLDGTRYQNGRLWDSFNFDPATKADSTHSHTFLPKHYNNNTSDNVANIINGSKEGYITKGNNNSHHVFGLQNNDGLDSFAVVGTDFSLSDNQPYTRTYFRVCDNYARFHIGHGATSNTTGDMFQFLSGGKLTFNGANYNAEMSFEYDWENGFTCMIISIDGVEKFRLEGGGWFQAPKIKTDLMSTKRAFITNCPTYSQASTSEIYKDANGFLKIR